MGVSEEIRQKLLPRFRETTADRVEKISAALLELERGAATPEVSEELARELHTLKGEARMMGFVGISSVVHAAEDLLKAVPADAPGDRLDALLKACDEIVPMLDASSDGGDAAAKLAATLRDLIGAAPPGGAREGGGRPGASGVLGGEVDGDRRAGGGAHRARQGGARGEAGRLHPRRRGPARRDRDARRRHARRGRPVAPAARASSTRCSGAGRASPTGSSSSPSACATRGG